MANLAYQNVSNLFPKSDFTLQGPLAGAMGGLQTMYGLNDLNNSAALAEINKQAEALKLSEANKNVPVDDLKRQVASNDLTTDLGQTDARAQSKLDTYKKQGFENQKTEAETRKQEVQTRSYAVNEELNFFYDENGKPRKSSLEMTSMYPQIKASLEAKGVKGLPDQFNAQTSEMLGKHRVAAYQSTQAFAQLEQQRLANMSHEKVGAANNATQLEVARIHASATRDAASDRTPLTRQIENHVATTGVLDESTVTQYAQILAAKKDATIEGVSKKAEASEKQKLNKMNTKDFAEYKKKNGLDSDASREDVASRAGERAIQKELIKSAIEILAPLAKKGLDPKVAQAAKLVGANAAYPVSTPTPNPTIGTQPKQYSVKELQARGYTQDANGSWIAPKAKPITQLSPEGN